MSSPSQRRAFSIAVFPRFGDELLVILHKRLGVWLPPGGELNPDETPIEAARRELLEETGLTGSFPRLSAIPGVPDGFLGYEEHPAGSKGLHMNFVFVADVTTRDVVPNDEYTDWRWVSLANGPWDLAPPNVRDFAKLALAARVLA
jgi:8-oxo-dGTP diphosphatase